MAVATVYNGKARSLVLRAHLEGVARIGKRGLGGGTPRSAGLIPRLLRFDSATLRVGSSGLFPPHAPQPPPIITPPKGRHKTTSDQYPRSSSDGYHLCARHKHKLVTIHGPTRDPRHRPPLVPPRHATWNGPFGTGYEAQHQAQEWAEWLDYDVTRCGTCFHEPKPTSAQQDRARERVARSDWMQGIGRRASRGGIANSRRRHN